MRTLVYFFNGAVIGVANIIPGVSGGTMALVLGIYERLLTDLSNISPNTFKIFFKLFTFKKQAIDDFKNEMKRLDVLFLFILTTGALTAILLLAHVMSFLLNEFHDPTYGFFFGLVLLSAVSPYKMIKKKGVVSILFIVLGAMSVIAVSAHLSGGEKLIEKAMLRGAESTLSSVKLNNFYVFVLGGIAISAMILPGISGSFLLLLLGGYFPVLKAISERDIYFLGIFAAGCIFGLLIFTRLLNFLLTNAYDITMSFLVGLVLGSLWMIWPFKKFLLVNSQKVYLNNIFPVTIGSNELITICTIIIGMFIVYLLLIIEKRNNR